MWEDMFAWRTLIKICAAGPTAMLANCFTRLKPKKMGRKKNRRFEKNVVKNAKHERKLNNVRGLEKI